MELTLNRVMNQQTISNIYNLTGDYKLLSQALDRFYGKQLMKKETIKCITKKNYSLHFPKIIFQSTYVV